MKRINVESGINIIINDSGNVPKKGFEVNKARTPYNFSDAIKLFKVLHSKYPTVYMYKVATGYRVEFKAYVSNYGEAIALRNEVEAVLEVYENDK